MSKPPDIKHNVNLKLQFQLKGISHGQFIRLMDELTGGTGVLNIETLHALTKIKSRHIFLELITDVPGERSCTYDTEIRLKA